jgi:dienelactone hydrolase
MNRRTFLQALAGAAIPCLAGCVDLDRAGGGPTVHAPERVPVDESLDASVDGVDGDAPVWVEARARDGGGHGWSSRALFEPEGGRVVLREARPVRGTYDDPDGMGLFWSMVPEAFDREVYDDDQRTQSVRLRVVRDGNAALAGDAGSAGGDSGDGGVLTETTVDRTLAAPASEETVVEEPVVGTLVESAGGGRAPGVVLFHGSGGNRPVGPARVLARHGFTVLALQYVSPEHPALPDGLVEVPVEYAGRAVEWLGSHDATTDDPVGLGGFSRGGELALLVGSRHDDVGSVVNWVGAAILFNAVVLDDDFAVAEETPDTAAWTVDGDPLAHPSRDAFSYQADLTAAYRTWLEERTPEQTLRAAEIPLERVDAPILLLSAGDDGVWPSRYLLNRAEARLEALDYEHRFEHHSYDAAGHGIRLPSLPTWPNRPGGPFGGTIAGTAAAAADAWPRAVSFFELGASR